MKLIRIKHPTKGELVIDDQHPLVKAEGVIILGDHVVPTADSGKPVEVKDPAVAALVTRIKAAVGSVTALVAVCASIAVEHNAVQPQVPDGHIKLEDAQAEKAEAIRAIIDEQNIEKLEQKSKLDAIAEELRVTRATMITPEQAEAMIKEALEKQFNELAAK